MSRFTYPHVIENGHGETLVFARRIPTATGDRLEGWNFVKPGAGPVMHVHHYQEEGFTVERGTLAYQRAGEAPQFAVAGESVVFRPGEPHRFWNAGTDDLICAAYVEPADNVEYFLGEIFASTKRSANARPDLFDAAYLARRYRSEYALHVVPALVQRILFPIVVAIGTMLGKYDKYADAPQPITR